METVSKKEKKSGRPAKDIKKIVRACVRLTQHEYFMIKEKALAAGMKPSGYIRQTVINARVTPRLTEEEIHFVRQLIGMSGNMNQVAKVCHREGLFEAMQYFENYRNLIDGIIKKLKP